MLRGDCAARPSVKRAEASILLFQYAILFTVSVILFEIRASTCFIYLFIMGKSHEVRTKQNLENVSLLSASLVKYHLYQKEKNRKTNYSTLGQVISTLHLACHAKNVSLIIYFFLT